MVSTICVRLVSTGELRELEPANQIVLARDVYNHDRDLCIFGQAKDYLARCAALTWLGTCPEEPAYVLEEDDTDEYGGFRWVLCHLVGAPRELLTTVPAPSSEPELRMAEDLAGRSWGAPRRRSSLPLDFEGEADTKA